MDEANYWWEQALKYKERAEKARKRALRVELLELGSACEEVAEEIEAHAPGG
ncbi:MAG: hypothetical protein KGL11_12075 [Alphaproteobacteria bacterium]|nr:hypothetical protein [Alphaproteobacteria bacterium]